MDSSLISIEAHSAGYGVGNSASITVCGTNAGAPKDGADRGLYVVIVDETNGDILDSRKFDTHSSSTDADAFAVLIENLPVGRIVVITVKDEATEKLTERAKRACMMIGSGLIRNLGYRGSWAIIGRKGAAPGTALERLSNTSAVQIAHDFPLIATRVAGITITARSMRGQERPGEIRIQGKVVPFRNDSPNSLKVVVIDDQTCGVLLSETYHIGPDLSSNNADAFAQVVANLPAGRLVAVVFQGPMCSGLTERARQACESLGSAVIGKLKQGDAWSLIGFKGAPVGSAAEAWSEKANALSALHHLPKPPESPPGFPISVRSAGYDVGNHADIVVGSLPAMDAYARGYGVRGLMLDVHVWRPSGTTQDGLYLCHGSCDSIFHPWVTYRTLTQALQEVVTFLKKKENENEIVTIFIESPSGWDLDTTSNDLFRNSFEASGANDLIFWPDLDAGQPPAGAEIWNVNPSTSPNSFTWPTVEDIVKSNKRLVLFVDRSVRPRTTMRHVVPFVWRYVRESVFSDLTTIAERDASSQPGRPANRSLFLWNHLSTITALLDHSFVNRDHALIKDAKAYVKRIGLVPNFIAIDFVECGDSLQVVNDINNKVWRAADPPEALADDSTLPLPYDQKMKWDL